MNYWQTVMFIYVCSVAGSHAGSWLYYLHRGRDKGAKAPALREAFSVGWYSALGAAVAVMIYAP